MKKGINERARLLVELPYAVKIAHDKTVDGGEAFLASHPELTGCMAQGSTVEEAVKALKEVTFEYIVSLLEDNIPVPLPSSNMTATGSCTIYADVQGNNSFKDISGDTGQPFIKGGISTAECVSYSALSVT